MRSLAWLKRFRRGTYRYHEEHRLIERWLSAIYTTAPGDIDLALEIAECQRLIKGYGETHRCGTAIQSCILRRLRISLHAHCSGFHH